MALPFTRYAELVAGEGTLARIDSLDARHKASAEKYALHQTQAFLRLHLEGTPNRTRDRGTDDSSFPAVLPEQFQQDLLDDLERWWDSQGVVEPLVVDLFLAHAEHRFHELLGHYDGKTGSGGYWARKEARERIRSFELVLFSQARLGMNADSSLYHRLVRFREL